MKAFLATCLVSVLALSGCDQEAGTGAQQGGFSLHSALQRGDAANQRGIRTLSVLNGAVRLRSPEGYCIDRQASHIRKGFGVAAACARVSDVALLPSVDGMLTYQIGDADSAMITGQETALIDLLDSDVGKALLADAGDAGTVAVHETILAQPGLVLVRFTDDQAQPIDGTGAIAWRAFLDMNDRMVTISLRPFAGIELGSDQAKALIQLAANELIAANAPVELSET